MVSPNGKEKEEQPKAEGFPDGVTIYKDRGCPHCGAKGSFYDVVTKGEHTVGPANTTKLFLFQMPYETLLGPKMITAMMDICPECGAMHCRGFMKQPVEQQVFSGGRRN